MTERKPKMNVVCVQLDSVWENKRASHDRARALIEAAEPRPDSLVVLPEMFATGFSMNVAAIDDGATRETANFLARTAREFGVYVMGGLVTATPAGKGRNECVVFSPAGEEYARYQKMQPFTLGGESERYEAGARPVVFPLHEFTVAPFICYDLRFPEVFRAATLRGANLITVIASWPDVREHHWLTLLKARAIENQAYVVGVNRCGADPQLHHSGRSLIVSPGGEVLADAGNGEGTVGAELDFAALRAYRSALPFLADIRPDYVKAE
jgi:omega-amidase